MIFGSLLAAVAVAVVCGLGLIVWLAGGQAPTRAKKFVQ